MNKKFVGIIALITTSVAAARATFVAAPTTARKSLAVGAAALAMLGMVTLAAPTPARADAQTYTYGLGTDGSPAATDYYTASEGFSKSTAPILTTILPLLTGMLAIWVGPSLGKRLIKEFTH